MIWGVIVGNKKFDLVFMVLGERNTQAFVNQVSEGPIKAFLALLP